MHPLCLNFKFQIIQAQMVSHLVCYNFQIKYFRSNTSNIFKSYGLNFELVNGFNNFLIIRWVIMWVMDDGDVEDARVLNNFINRLA